MPRVCLACKHKDRITIDDWLALGQTHKEIAKAFGLSRDTIQRHSAHIAPAKAKTIAQLDDAQVIHRHHAEELRQEALVNLQLARSARDVAGANGAIRAAVACLDHMGKLDGVFARAEAQAWAAVGLPSEAALKAAARMYLGAQEADEGGLFSRSLRLVAAYLARHPEERQHALEQIGGVMVEANGREHAEGRNGQSGGPAEPGEV